MNSSNLFLTICRLLGVAPMGGRGPIRWIHCIWCLFLLLYIWIGSIWKCIDFKVEIPTIEKLLYLIEFPGNMLTIGFLSYYAILSRPCAQEVELQIHRLINGLESKVVKFIYRKHDQRTLNLLGATIAFHCLCFGVDIGTYNCEWWTTGFSNSVYNLPALMMSFGVLQYVHPLYFLWLLLEQMSRRLEELKSRQRPPKGIAKPDARYETAFAVLVDAGGDSALLLEEMRSACHHIDQLHKQLASRYGIFLLLNFFNSLACFCMELYLVFNFFESPLWEESLLLIYRLLWLLMHGGRIWLILSVNERILDQKCYLCQLLNELVVCSSRLERTLNRFLQQLHTSLAQPPMACGIVALDTLELGGFIGVMMAIVIFLIQIGLGNKSLMGVALNRSNWVYI
ncbi:hypothetical protein KR009_009140 [Drosophila setifemur]|nr:hypothetical protein KR009_009140 [Drosophila setifemur]